MIFSVKVRDCVGNVHPCNLCFGFQAFDSFGDTGWSDHWILVCVPEKPGADAELVEFLSVIQSHGNDAKFAVDGVMVTLRDLTSGLRAVLRVKPGVSYVFVDKTSAFQVECLSNHFPVCECVHATVF